MDKRRILGITLVVAALGFLVYLQVRTWTNFDWATFWSRTEHVSWVHVALAVAVTYIVYVVRAVRWKILLKPMRQTSTVQLLAPQFIGFTGLALLGRPGEMVRPYLIARKEQLSFSSQIAVWLVERILDMGSVALVFIIQGFIGDPMWQRLGIPGLQTKVKWSAAAFLAGILGLILIAILLRFSGDAFARRMQQRHGGKLARLLGDKVAAFASGLKTIQDFTSFTQLLLLSFFVWGLIGFSFWLVLHAYGGKLAELGPGSIILLLVGAMFGSLLQLPGVGGGSQLATIAILNRVFGIQDELAVSCGILIWAATFMSVIPTGLLLARHEHVSLRAVAAQQEKEKAAITNSANHRSTRTG